MQNPDTHNRLVVGSNPTIEGAYKKPPFYDSERTQLSLPEWSFNGVRGGIDIR
jgi:hypothetical protein